MLSHEELSRKTASKLVKKDPFFSHLWGNHLHKCIFRGYLYIPIFPHTNKFFNLHTIMMNLKAGPTANCHFAITIDNIENSLSQHMYKIFGQGKHYSFPVKCVSIFLKSPTKKSTFSLFNQDAVTSRSHCCIFFHQ